MQYVILNHKGQVLIQNKKGKFEFSSKKQEAEFFDSKEAARARAKIITRNYKIKPSHKAV